MTDPHEIHQIREIQSCFLGIFRVFRVFRRFKGLVDLAHYRAFMHELAARSGDFVRPLFGSPGLAVETKADHAKLQAFGQQLLDKYVAEVQRIQEAGQQSWVRTRDEWKSNFINDPDLGKSNQASTLTRCASMIEQYGGSKEQVQELRQILAITGAGDHPGVIRLLNNIGKVLSEPTTTAVGRQLSPAATTSRSARRYANTLGANGAN
jgi:hypothetical protein